MLQEAGHSCFDFPLHSVFTFDVFWGSLDTSIFRNSSSAAYNTRSRLTSRLSSPFLMTMFKFFKCDNKNYCQTIKFQLHSLKVGKIVEKCMEMSLLLTNLFPVLHFKNPWTQQKTVRFSDVFRGYKNVTLGANSFCKVGG